VNLKKNLRINPLYAICYLNNDIIIKKKLNSFRWSMVGHTVGGYQHQDIHAHYLFFSFLAYLIHLHLQ